LLDVHTNEGSDVNLDKDGFFFAVGVRNYLSNEFKDPMSTTRAVKKNKTKTAKSYSYKGFTDPTGPNPWVKWEAKVIEGDGQKGTILQTVGMHVCTEFEWGTYFEKPAKKDAIKIA